MRPLTEYIMENENVDGILDNTLMLSTFKKLRTIIKRYINKNYKDINKIYLVFKNADEAQSWVDFSYFDINGKKFSELNGNFMIDNKIYNDSKTYLNNVTNVDLMKTIDSSDNFPYISITAFKNKMKITFSNRLKTKKYNITAYLIEL